MTQGQVNVTINNGVAAAAARPMLQLKTNRGMLKFILLSIITFGIYSLVFYSSISSDINLIASKYDRKRTMHYCLLFFIVAPITCGLGVLFWFNNLSVRIFMEMRRRQIGYNFGAGSFWGWNILGSLIFIGPFVYLHKLCTAMNLLAADYNEKG